VVDRKNGYLELRWANGPLEYKLQAALFLLQDHTPLVAVSYWEGASEPDGHGGVVFFQLGADGKWASATPLPDLTEHDFHLSASIRKKHPDDLLLYRFELPREGTTLKVVAELQRLPSHHDDSGPTGEYTLDDSGTVELRWDKKKGAFVKAR
jgi:hypothetical protein